MEFTPVSTSASIVEEGSEYVVVLRPATHNEQHGTGHDQNLNQRSPLFDKHISHTSYLVRENGRKARSPLGLLWERLLSCVLSHHGHRTGVSFPTVLSMDVLQHCMSSQRSLVPNASVKILHAIRVRTGKTYQGYPVTVSANAVHN
jgi:hypothetical protein